MAALLTGCVYDKHSSDPTCPGAQEETFFLSFVLTPQGSSSATKADAGVKDIGLLEEQLVKTVDVYFYDASGKFLGMKMPEPGKQTVSSTPTDDISSVVGEFVVRMDYKPAKMLVALNAGQKFGNKTLSEARAAMQEASTSWQGAATDIKFEGTTYNVRPFYMTSATYANGTQDICEFDIPADKILLSESDALLNPVNLYVERLASKVQVNATRTKFMVPAVTRYEGITTQVEILGWGLNALNSKAYWFKNIDTGWSFSWTLPGGSGWSDFTKFRSHWAKDPNYDGGTYPLDYGDFIKATPLDPADCDLKYVSWNDLGSDFNTGAAYCLENTADGSILPTDRSRNGLYPKVTHVLVKAQLSFGLGAGKTAADDPAGYVTETDFYRYKGVFYTINNIFDAILEDQKLSGNPYYKDAAKTVEADASDFVLVEYYGEKLYVRVTGTVYDKNGVAVAADALQNIRVDGFKDGHFYYKIPVEHLTPAPATPGANYLTAQYGVVRNHNYVITLGALNGVGTGVWNAAEPIVPVTAPEEYIVSAYVTVSPWLQFENRFVFIDPTGMLVSEGQQVNRWSDIGPENPDWGGDGWYE